MNEFRTALQSLAADTAALADVQAVLRATLAQAPADAEAITALIEGAYRAGAIPGQSYLDLMADVRAVPAAAAAVKEDQDARTRLRAPDTPTDARTRLRAGRPVQGEATRYRPAPYDSSGAVRRSSVTDRSSPQRSGPTGSQWSDPSRWEHTDALQPGDIVKERFVLEEIIGQGGMGVVFKARDQRKEEAQDRHPHVALKVLNEDFKHHPESLKALQREARKAQNLAHPNIVTVFDFDRDGSNVYIVMELLEGEPLDKLIRSLDGRGMGLAEALPIIRALCGALSYAHQHNVVHSDFKPANAFISRSGAIKVFDFGIARAAKFKAEAGIEETGSNASPLTLFDAGTLGALTPAYASCEMMEGHDPDPRDDVYALGCVAYELLTGSHPFQRKSAVQARDAKLTPKPVRRLTGRQWRGLRRALSFERNTRSASADAFLQEISPQRRSPLFWTGIAATVLIAVAAVLLLPRYLQTRHVEALTARMTSGVAADVDAVLPELQALPESVRASMMLDEKARAALVEHFRRAIATAFDAGQQRYDYPVAVRRLAELKGLLPDSQQVAQIAADLEARKNDEIKRQSDSLDEYLRQGWLVAEQNPSNARGVLAIVAQIDPKHPLLGDPRLPSAFAEQAQLAVRRSDITLAQSLTSAGLAMAPRDATLQDLNDMIGREAAVRARSARLAEVRRRLGDDLPRAETLAQLDAVHDDLLLLQADEARDPGLLRVQARLQQLLDRDIAALVGAVSLDEAQTLLARHADLASSDYVIRQRAMLAGSYASKGVSTAMRDAAAADLERALDALLAAPARDDNWDGKVRTQFAVLSAYLAPTDAYMADAVRRAAAVHLQAADNLRGQGRLSEAEHSLQLASHYGPDLPQIAVEREQLAKLRAEQDARDQEQKRVAEISARKQKFQDQASANDVAAAADSLRVLRSGLPADDPFLQAAPKSLAESYVRLAEAALRERRFDAVDKLLGSALEQDRGNARVALVRAELAKQMTARSTSPPQTPTLPTPPAGQQVATPIAPATPAQSVQPATDAASTTVAKVVAPASTQQAATTGGACAASLAGYGKRSRGICYDTVPGGRGPELVVVPAGSGIPKAFAITRSEISGSDYALYCQQAGRCTASQGSLPVTGIPLAEAQQYAQWLSASSGVIYRLPTEAEWIYVANAPGGGTERDYNCVVELNGQKIRGFALVGVREGQSNGWGLYNLLGNAREWVKTAQGWGARGGAYTDPIAQCDAGSGRSSSGAADAATGFRLVRELL